MLPSPARSALLGLVATGLLVLASERRPPRPGEPLVLRWARTAAAHPTRTWLALALLSGALLPGRGRSAGAEARDDEGGPSAP